MKFGIRSLAAMTVLTASSVLAREDHLEPADGYLSSYSHSHAYLTSVREVLVRGEVQSPAVMVTLPSFQVESMVLLRIKGTECVVVSATCSDQIWSSERRESVKIEQMERVISKKVADAISALFALATSGARYTKDPILGLDGVTYHFSSFVQGVGVRAGQVWTPDPDSACGQLVRLGVNLHRYVRREIDEELLMKDAEALLKRFRRNA